jgi:DNA-binding LacI/PurR family transcriptional regulator
MRYGRFYNIGYFEAKRSATAWPLLGAESGVFDAASAHNYNVVLIRLPSDGSNTPSLIPSVFRERNLDALILSHAGNITPELEEAIDASEFPVVYLNEKKRYNAVYINDLGGMKASVEHLIGLGHTKIAYMSNIPIAAHYSVKDRKIGYEKAMREAGLKPKFLDIPLSHPSWEKAVYDWFLENEDLEAVACYSDFTAMQLLRVLYKSPISVPEKLSVMGFGNDFGVECGSVKLTTMSIPFYEMGKSSVEMALALLNQRPPILPAKIFQPALVTRDSTSAHPSFSGSGHTRE